MEALGRNCNVIVVHSVVLFEALKLVAMRTDESSECCFEDRI